MAKRYEELRQPRFAVEVVDGVEEIRIRAARNWLLLPFVSIWLVFWTIGGMVALSQLFARFDPFLLVWLAFWAFGWLVAAAMIGWQLAGVETIRIVHGDLEIGYRLLAYQRRRLFRGSEIRHLAASRINPFGRFGIAFPMSRWMPFGAIGFSYGARSYYAAPGLDPAEGEMIVDHLRKRLPLAAADRPSG